MMSSIPKTLPDIANHVVRSARAAGAKEAAATASRSREVEVEWRDGKLEKVQEATTRSVDLELFVDGRWSQVSSSDLRPEALDEFVRNAVAMARALSPIRTGPSRTRRSTRGWRRSTSRSSTRLTRPSTPRPGAASRRRVEEAARAVPGSEKILSVTTNVSDVLSEGFRVASNGFEGRRRGTQFWISASTSVKDPDGRRPEDSASAGGRFRADLPTTKSQGALSTERALSRIGSKKGESATLPMVVEGRVAGRLLSALLGPLSGAALQQKRSFLDGKFGQPVGSERLDLVDDPLLPKGLGSRLWDGEGISAKRMPIFEKGVVRNGFIDTYYGRKLGLPPTTGGTSNVILPPGTKAATSFSPTWARGSSSPASSAATRTGRPATSLAASGASGSAAERSPSRSPR